MAKPNAAPGRPAEQDNTGNGINKTVGVYDRPASADLLAKIRIPIIVIAVIISLLTTYWYLR